MSEKVLQDDEEKKEGAKRIIKEENEMRPCLNGRSPSGDVSAVESEEFLSSHEAASNNVYGHEETFGRHMFYPGQFAKDVLSSLKTTPHHSAAVLEQTQRDCSCSCKRL